MNPSMYAARPARRAGTGPGPGGAGRVATRATESAPRIGRFSYNGESTSPLARPAAPDRPQHGIQPVSEHIQGAMKTPAGLQPLIDDGVIDEVIRSLKSGKEATVYVVRSGTQIRCAKVYRDMGQRSFQKRAKYQEGRKVRGSRQARAMSKSTRFGRKEQESAWKNAEVDALYQLVAADVRVPKPYGYFNDVLIMELVTDGEGNPAPRLGEVDLPPETALEYHRFLIRQIVRMLSIGLIHGDLSEFNVLVAPDGPVIIDLPQVVNAAGNNGALAMLERDVNNIRGTLGRFAPELLETEFAREMWSLFEQGELTADTELTGVFARDETPTDPDSVLVLIEDAREEAIQRELAAES
jgi:RIO kinase 1